VRFSLAHKLTSYLMVLSAVSSLLFSPELGPIGSVLALLGVAGSWFAEPPAYPRQRLTLAWNIATVLLLVVLALQVFAGGSVIAAGVYFLLGVLVNKLFNRQHSRDYLQVYVITFLMLVAATTLNTGLSYAICFVLYVIFTTWSLVLLHLRREMEENYLLKHAEGAASEKVEVQRILNSRRIVGPGFLASTAVISVGVIVGSAAIFAFFPRIGFGLFATHKRHGTAMAGFSDEVQLGHHGRIRDNPQVVMRVIFPHRTKGRKRPPSGTLLWRGSVFDRYENGRWMQSNRLRGRSVPIASENGFYHANHAPGVPLSATRDYIRKNLLKQEIYLEPLDSQVLFAIDRPVAIEVPRRKVTGRPIFVPRRGPFGELRAMRRRSGVRYTAYSKRYPPNGRWLRRAQPIRDQRWQRYLQLPPKLPRRIITLSRRLTAKKKTVYDKVKALHMFLRRNYRYTLQLTHASRQEPIDEFLFRTRAGHCEYFATSLTLLARGQRHSRSSRQWLFGRPVEQLRTLSGRSSRRCPRLDRNPLFQHRLGGVRSDATASRRLGGAHKRSLAIDQRNGRRAAVALVRLRRRIRSHQNSSRYFHDSSAW
jgi:hypothetical protein